LQSSLARAKASLPSADDALDVLPSLIDDSPDTFQLDFESAQERVTSLLDVAASSFDTAGARDCGWKGVIDTAKVRLLHAQVTFFDGLFGFIVVTTDHRLHYLQRTGIGDPAYLHILASAFFHLFCSQAPLPPHSVAVRQRQLLTILRAACFSTAQHLDHILLPLQQPDSAAAPLGMHVLRQV
jgi:hypothetical protein